MKAAKRDRCEFLLIAFPPAVEDGMVFGRSVGLDHLCVTCPIRILQKSSSFYPLTLAHMKPERNRCQSDFRD